MNRRDLITGLFLATFTNDSHSVGRAIDNAAAQSWAADSKQKREWMQTAILDSPQQTKAEGALELYWFPESMYALLQSISWEANSACANIRLVDVPKGFVTDLASIPRVFFSALRPDGRYAYASVVHDYLYWTQEHKRRDADEVLKLCMQEFKVPAATVAIIYDAVRAGGGSAWEQNSRLREKGEKRVLSKFPSDPGTLWSAWKKDSGNFR